jgi:hypothetical protein
MQPPSLGGSALSTTLSYLTLDHQPVEPRRPTPSSAPIIQIPELSKEIRLFNTIATLKIAVANVSMHLDAEWRARLFSQIDMLLDPEDWDESYKLADAESFTTFLRMVLLFGALPRLGLGIDEDGHILAGWRNEIGLLSLTFLRGDRVRWSIVRREKGETESAAGETTLDRLLMVLKPYDPERWYGNANYLPSA